MHGGRSQCSRPCRFRVGRAVSALTKGHKRSMPPGGVTKKVQVKLTSCHIPLKRKYILIKEGKQLLMLKALGDSRSVYSIEERGIARRGITRSGKRHFQFSLPKFVNALEGMNNHNQHPNDHVTSKFPHRSIEASHTAYKSRKGHFARKSTGNNIKHTIRLKSEEAKQQQSSQDAQNFAKTVKLHSVTDVSPLASAHKNCEPSSHTDNLKVLHQKLKGGDQKDSKGPNVSTRASKQKQTSVHGTPWIKGDSQKERKSDHQEGIECSQSPAGKTEASGEQYAHHTEENAAIVKPSQVEDKENVGECENFNKDERNCSSNQSTLLNGSISRAGQQLENEESLKVTARDKTDSVSSKQSDQDYQTSLEKPSEMLDATVEKVTSNLHLDLNSHPKQLSESVKKRDRASTPTPESPGRTSIVNKLSRKRHRSASPKVCSSIVEGNRDLIVKPHKEPIKLHTKNYEKVKNAFKNFISQRKDKTTNKADIENALNVQVESVNSNISPKSKDQDHSVSDQSGTPSIKGKQPLSDKHEPTSKKAKLSLAGDEKEYISHKEVAKVPTDTSKTPGNHPQIDSDDGLARLMKDFQSAIEASTTQKNCNGAAPKLKYISKKTSQHSVVAKPQKLPLHVEMGRREESKKTVLFKPSHNLKKLEPIPTEAVSSDEELEHPPSEVDTKTSVSILSSDTEVHAEQDAQDSQKGKQCISAVGPTLKIPKSIIPPTPSPDRFMVVDEIGFPTTEDSNSTQSTCNVSESQQTPSPNTPEPVIVPHISGGKEQLSEAGLALRDGQTYNPASDKAQGLDKTAKGANNITVSGKEALENGHNYDNSKDSETSEDCLQDVGQRNDNHGSSLKRDYESVTRGDGKRPKISHELQSVALESHYTQTDEIVISKKDKAIATEMSGKSDVKNQATQFDSEPKDIDTEEISRIVAAMYESECEEKERLVKALQVQKEREDKWRKTAEDYARQLQELKDQLDGKKGKKTTEKGTNTSEETSTALPVIISSQSTQTERIQTKPMPIVIPVEEKAVPSTPVVPSKPSLPPSEGKNDHPQNILPSATTTDKVESVILSSTKTNATNERKLPIGPSAVSTVTPENSKATYPLQNVSKHQSPARSLSAPSESTKIQNDSSSAKSLQQNGGVKHAASEKNAKAEASKDVTIIDLTDTEDVNTGESLTATPTNRTAVQPRSSVLPGKMVQGSPLNLRKSPGIPSKPNILQLTSKAITKEQSVENKVKALTPPSHLPRSPVGTTSDKTTVIPKRSQPSSVQGIQRVVQTTGTIKVSANLPVNQLVTIGQPIVTVPPTHLQASSIGGSIYSHQSTQVPVFSTIGNIGMIIGNQPHPRQESAMPGVLQTQGFLQRSIVTQGPADILNQKAVLEKRQQELQQQLQQSYQRSNNKKITEISVQLQAIMTELRNINDRLNASVQGQRNIRLAQVSAPPNVTTQASRLSLAPPYNIAAGTIPPVSTVHQLNPTIKQREVVNGVKPYVPLSTLNTTLTNAPNKSAGKTWFPETRQGAEIIDKQGKGNKFSQHFNQPARPHAHPAKLPVLQQPPTPNGNPLLPPPSIRITHSPEGVVLSWNINVKEDHPTVKKYFLYAYQVLNTPPSTSHWKRIGEVGALAPPMACTLNQFQPGSTYFLAICAVDVYDRPGIFSKMEEVVIPT